MNNCRKMCNRGDGIKIYKYIYVKSKTEGLITGPDHREIINKYSQEGWRFITAIPTWFNLNGKIKQFDLVFEKEKVIPLEVEIL